MGVSLYSWMKKTVSTVALLIHHQPKYFKSNFQRKKTTKTIFWDGKGILMVDFMHKEITINVTAYWKTFKLKKIKDKRRGMLIRGMSLLYDNARLIQDLLVSFGWNIVTHPSYTPDLALSDYYFSINCKRFWVKNDFQMTRRSRKLSKSGFSRTSGGYTMKVYKS